MFIRYALYAVFQLRPIPHVSAELRAAAAFQPGHRTGASLRADDSVDLFEDRCVWFRFFGS